MVVPIPERPNVINGAKRQQRKGIESGDDGLFLTGGVFTGNIVVGDAVVGGVTTDGDIVGGIFAVLGTVLAMLFLPEMLLLYSCRGLPVFTIVDIKA